MIFVKCWKFLKEYEKFRAPQDTFGKYEKVVTIHKRIFLDKLEKEEVLNQNDAKES